MEDLPPSAHLHQLFSCYSLQQHFQHLNDKQPNMFQNSGECSSHAGIRAVWRHCCIHQLCKATKRHTLNLQTHSCDDSLLEQPASAPALLPQKPTPVSQGVGRLTNWRSWSGTMREARSGCKHVFTKASDMLCCFQLSLMKDPNI